MIPVSVVVTTKNEAANIGRCLAALGDFSEIVVVDSGSTDATVSIAKAAGAPVVPFVWNGQYPKKRQWCLDNLTLKHDWVFFVDADEVVTDELVRELENVFHGKPSCAGYFVKGHYVVDGRVLRHGLCNNKLCLLDRRKMVFPVVDDLNIPGMGEMEGHYQPVCKDGGSIGVLRAGLLHYAHNEGWEERHRRYAAWEIAMNRGKLWPADPVRWRQALKAAFRRLPFRPLIAFLHSYVLRRGFLEGKAGWRLALSRYRYYAMIAAG